MEVADGLKFIGLGPLFGYLENNNAHFGNLLCDGIGKPDIIDKANPLEHMYHIIRAYKYVKGAKNA